MLGEVWQVLRRVLPVGTVQDDSRCVLERENKCGEVDGVVHGEMIGVRVRRRTCTLGTVPSAVQLEIAQQEDTLL